MTAQIQAPTSCLGDRPQITDSTNQAFEALLDYLKHNQGCDLTDYKRPTLMRRFQHRMRVIGISTYESYLQYLQCNSDEYLILLDDVLINVTCFFRDRNAWDHLAAEIIPKIIADKQPNEPIRVWSAGCAAGQEIYTLLILLAEALGLEACLEQVRCFATDADEAVLWQARQATYSSQEVMSIPPDLLEKYFKQTEKGYVFHPALRRIVTFARHDLVQNAPISKLDLLICRNVMIYFNSEAQAALLSRFHFALKNSGFLFLGKAETLVNCRHTFTPVNTSQRIYAKESSLELTNYVSMAPKQRMQQANHLTANVSPTQSFFWEMAFESSSFAYLAIDVNGCLLYANKQAKTLFGLTFKHWKRPFKQLELAKLVSHSTLTKALHSRQNLTAIKNVAWTTEKGTVHLDVDVSRVLSTKNHLLGVTLTFIEKNDYKQLTDELESTRLQLNTVSKTLEATKSELGIVHSKLESTQRELQNLNQG